MFSARLFRLACFVTLAAVPAVAENAPKQNRAQPRTATAPKPDLEKLRRELESGDPRRILAALEEIRHAGPTAKGIATPVHDLLIRGASLEIAMEAMKVAEGLALPELSPALAQYVRHRSADLRRLAVRALGSTGGPVAVQGLRQALRGSDPIVRNVAAAGLGSLGAREAIPDLVTALDHQVWPAARSIGQLCVARDCEAFLSRLGRLKFEIIVEGLEPMLTRPAVEVPVDLKLQIIERIALLGTDKALAWLKSVFERWPSSGDPKVKKALQQAAQEGAAPRGGGMRGALFVGAFAGALAACGATRTPEDIFSISWKDDRGASIEHVRQKLRGSPLPPGPDIAVFVTSSGLVGQLLPHGTRWAYGAVPPILPIIAGSVIIVDGSNEITALDALSGAPLWSLQYNHSSLVGAADDGEFTVLSVLSSAGAQFLAVDREGEIVLRSAADSNLGVPAALGGIAFVPWGNQYVSAIDLSTGEESGRLLARQQVSRAVRMGSNLYFGEVGFLRFDSAISGASENRANSLALPIRELPGAPTWKPGGVLSLKASARTHIQAYAAPADIDGKPVFAKERYATTYFPVVLGFHSRTGKLMWVRTLSSDVVGGAATEQGFVFCTERGGMEFLSSIDGSPVHLSGNDARKQGSLDEPVRACAVQADGLKFPLPGRAESLAKQIGEALMTSHPEVATVHAFLMGELSQERDPIATKILIDVASNPRTGPSLRHQAGTLLALRRNGAEYMLGALEREYDFLADVLTMPPVGPLAVALLAMNDRRAAPFLARYLNAPETEPQDIEDTAQALRTLAGEGELAELKMFFSLYRATADDDALVNAVVYVAEALLRIGGADGRRIVEIATRDTLTHPRIKEKLGALVGSKGERSSAPT